MSPVVTIELFTKIDASGVPPTSHSLRTLELNKLKLSINLSSAIFFSCVTLGNFSNTSDPGLTLVTRGQRIRKPASGSSWQPMLLILVGVRTEAGSCP